MARLDHKGKFYCDIESGVEKASISLLTDETAVVLHWFYGQQTKKHMRGALIKN